MNNHLAQFSLGRHVNQLTLSTATLTVHYWPLFGERMGSLITTEKSAEWYAPRRGVVPARSMRYFLRSTDLILVQ
jgi:hypothetical protein